MTNARGCVRSLLAAILLAACSSPGYSQAIQYRDSDDINNVNVSAATPLPVSGSFSLSGFTPTAGAAKNLSVSGTSADTTLPAGTDVVVTNTGSNDVFFRIQVGAGTAVTTDQVVKAGAAVGLHVGTATHISAITASSTSTLNLSGGVGLATGYGGGGSGSGGDASAANQTAVQATAGSDASKAVAIQGITSGKAIGVSAASGSIASGAIASGAVASGAVASGAFASGSVSDGAIVTLGAKTDAKSTATDTTSVSAMSVLKQISASAQAGVSTTAATAPTSGVYVTGRAATASPTAVTDGQAVGVQLTEGGRTVTAPYAVKELMVRGTTTSTDTSAHTIIAAGGASVKTYVVAIQCGRTDAGTSALTLTFNDSASSVFVLPAGGATNLPLPVPLVTAANTAFQVTSGTGVSTLYCSAQGYSGP